MEEKAETINEAPENEETNSEEVAEVRERKIVVPGEVIISGEDYLPGEGARREGDDILAGKYGMAEIVGRVVKIISLSGAFIPRKNNVVLGRVIDYTHNGWLIDIDCASSGFLPVAEAPRFVNKNELDGFLAIGEMISAKIWGAHGRSIDLSFKGRGLGKLEGGYVFRINPSRVPRIIGREGSMINLIKEKTGCTITVGQNGWIWLRSDSSDDKIRARKAIEYVANKVHVGGLTDKMEEWFEKN